jgi:hypothetical protein
LQRPFFYRNATVGFNQKLLMDVMGNSTRAGGRDGDASRMPVSAKPACLSTTSPRAC